MTQHIDLENSEYVSGLISAQHRRCYWNALKALHIMPDGAFYVRDSP